MNRVPVIIEGLAYILSRLGRVDKIHLVKLMYLADKYHILSYGRTITEDSFYAFPHGPAGSKTMDVLEYDSYVLQEYMERAKELIEAEDGNEFKLSEESNINDFEMIAESEIEALDFAVANFGKMDKWDVVNYTHGLEEWKQFEQLFKNNRTKRETINLSDVLISPHDRYFSIPDEHIQVSLQIATGSID
jgi:uncharacterized phage-associated protein